MIGTRERVVGLGLMLASAARSPATSIRVCLLTGGDDRSYALGMGSLRNDIIEAKTGFLCRPADAADLARTIRTYFASDLYENLEGRCSQI